MNDEEPKIGTFNYGLIAVDMEELPVAIYERIRREWRAQLGEPLCLFLELLVRISGDAWHTIRYICRDGRRREFVYAVPPLARTLLDALSSVVFIFDNPAVNMRWYYASGWLDQYREYKRYLAEYGGKPGWEHLAKLPAEIEKTARLAKITSDERSDAEQPKPKLIRWWPNPGVFGSDRAPTTDPKRTEFLLFLNAWFYGRLSGDSHLNFPGLLRRGWFYAEQSDEARDPEQIHYEQRSIMAFEALTIQVALLTEISCQLGLDYEKNRLRGIWDKLLSLDLDDPRQFYQERYTGWLS